MDVVTRVTSVCRSVDTISIERLNDGVEVVLRDVPNHSGGSDITLNAQIKAHLKPTSGGRNDTTVGEEKTVSKILTDVEVDEGSVEEGHAQRRRYRSGTPYPRQKSTKGDISARSRRSKAPSAAASRNVIAPSQTGPENSNELGKKEYAVKANSISLVLRGFFSVGYFASSVTIWIITMQMWMFGACNYFYYGVPAFGTHNHHIESRNIPFYMPSQFCPKYVVSDAWLTPSSPVSTGILTAVHFVLILTIAMGALCFFVVWRLQTIFVEEIMPFVIKFIKRTINSSGRPL